jgi:hypothetical protein
MSPAHSAPSCQAGKCQFSCQLPFIACGGTCVDPRTDLDHCGDCATTCKAPMAAIATCSDGQCGVNCPSGKSSCKSKCVDFKSDDANCGACGNECKGVLGCVLGHCL